MQKGYLKKGLVSNVDNAILVKDVDEKKGIVTGYFAVFNVVDSDGDVIIPGAFKRSLQNNLRRIKHLWQHNPEQPLSSAATENLILKEDSYGLHFQSKLSTTSWGRDAIKCYVDGTVDEHSIGYGVEKEKSSDNFTIDKGGRKTPANELQSLKFWEGSTVTWGANQNALTQSVKSMTKDDAFDYISKRMHSVEKAIRNGTFENEEIFDMLELHHKQLLQVFADLTNSTQPAVNAPDPQTKECNNDLKTSEILTLIELQKQSLTFN